MVDISKSSSGNSVWPLTAKSVPALRKVARVQIGRSCRELINSTQAQIGQSCQELVKPLLFAISVSLVDPFLVRSSVRSKLPRACQLVSLANSLFWLIVIFRRSLTRLCKSLSFRFRRSNCFRHRSYFVFGRSLSFLVARKFII